MIRITYLLFPRFSHFVFQIEFQIATFIVFGEKNFKADFNGRRKSL